MRKQTFRDSVKWANGDKIHWQENGTIIALEDHHTPSCMTVDEDGDMIPQVVRTISLWKILSEVSPPVRFPGCECCGDDSFEVELILRRKDVAIKAQFFQGAFERWQLRDFSVISGNPDDSLILKLVGAIKDSP